LGRIDAETGIFWVAGGDAQDVKATTKATVITFKLGDVFMQDSTKH
jgi:hypothetical protein